MLVPSYLTSVHKANIMAGILECSSLLFLGILLDMLVPAVFIVCQNEMDSTCSLGLQPHGTTKLVISPDSSCGLMG
jgi:hypothetical protein